MIYEYSEAESRFWRAVVEIEDALKFRKRFRSYLWRRRFNKICQQPAYLCHAGFVIKLPKWRT